MRFFSGIVPLLFASPPSLRTNSYLSAPLAATVENLNVDVAVESENVEYPTRKLINDVKLTYRELATGCISRDYSPTIQMIYTSPPDERTYFRENEVESILAEKHETKSEKEIVYEKIKDSHKAEKPILVYLPGLDGVGISGTTQFDELSDNFEFWRMVVDKKDRSSFTELTTAVSNFIYDIAVKTGRDVILAGESFGGLLAPSVAMRVKATTTRNGDENPIKGMVLINPATSFGQTQWSTFGPLLASLRHIEQEDRNESSLPTPYSVIGGIALSATIPDSNQFQRILSLITDTKVSTTDELSDVLATMKDGFGILAENLPAAVVDHRIAQWLPVGCDVVNPRLDKLDTPTLVIAGEDDNMLPTKEEGERLIQTMPDCTGIFVKNTGHFILDERFNLTEAIIDAPFYPKRESVPTKKYDPILDWDLPSDEVIKNINENQVKVLTDLVSPKFFSTNKKGKRSLGLGQIPKPEGPLLFIANHQLFGLDLGMIISQLLEERDIKARGLAHPVIFGTADGFGGNNAAVSKRNKDGPIKEDGPNGIFEQFGAVMVTPRNYYRLMQTGQTGLLFPGGVREVFHGKDEAYELFWPEDKLDFVRTASRFNATIVPISAVGAADSLNILVDSPDVLDLPFGIGERAANQTKNVMSARFDQDNTAELFQPPVIFPKIPARHYFVFGKPFDTENIDHRNAEECTKLYAGVKGELRRGLDDLLVARENDPYKDTPMRIAVEKVSGKPAPTFDVSELNR
uniref:AB hydrolase-1 domain-containing protein n=1 Tax=Chaetoceros debilis TaxID=122233 RepID=A0A7S3Q0K0_9STRA